MRAALLLSVLVGMAHAGDPDPKGEWFGGLRQLRRGTFLDLDNGGLFPSAESFPGGRAEMSGETVLCTSEGDPGFAPLAPVLSRAPWMRVATSEGNTSWVQVLRPEPDAVIHFLTRLGGEGEPLACPRAPYAIGRTYAIDLRFEAPCRIERSDDHGLTFRELAAQATSPFVDRDVVERQRYVYRLCALDDGGRRGVPRTLLATTESRGVFAGEIVLDGNGRRSVDLLRGGIDDEAWDLQLASVWERGITVRHSHRLFCRPLALGEDPFAPAWEGGSAREVQIAQGDSFLAPLRGGGVALCRLVQIDEWRLRLAYEAYGEDSALPRPPAVEALPVDGGVRVRVSAADPWYVPQVAVRDRLRGGAPRLLRLTAGEAIDGGPAPDALLVYEALALDEHERRGAVGQATVNLRADEVHEGKFDLRGVNDRHSLDPCEAAQSPAGDLQLVEMHDSRPIFTLRAPGGMCVVGTVADAEPLYDGIAGALPDDLAWERVEVFHLDAGAGVVLLVRTPHGGFAKVALAAHAGGVTARFAFNPRTPRFGPLGQAHAARGLLLHGIEADALPPPR